MKATTTTTKANDFLVVKTLKNVSIDNHKFTPNSIVLLKQSFRDNSDGSVDVNTKFVEVCNVPNTKNLTIIESMLRFVLAETKLGEKFKAEFTETGLELKKVLSQFFSSNVIYRTNSEGIISKAITSELPLKYTGLNVRTKHNIMNCKPEFLDKALKQHAKAVYLQMSYISMLTATAGNIAKLDANGTISQLVEQINKEKAESKQSEITSDIEA